MNQEAPSLVEWLAVRLGLTCREVQGMLHWQTVLVEMGIGVDPSRLAELPDARFELGLCAWARLRERSLEAARAKEGSATRRDELRGEALEAGRLLASLAGLVQLLQSYQGQFAQATAPPEEDSTLDIYPRIS